MFHDVLNVHDWLYHYEVVVSRQGRDQILARVPSQLQAEVAIAQTRARVEVSRPTIRWRRVRGTHPVKAAELCTLVLVVVLTLPWFWPRTILSMVCAALIWGLLTSGTHWRQGGADDR